jgi:hypothetical protein
LKLHGGREGCHATLIQQKTIRFVVLAAPFGSKIAEVLGIDVPAAILVRADEQIE